ncbi:hypothetical protein N2152v2_010652 [Parachlorella kessleri]
MTIERHNLGSLKYNLYYQDLFHTLVNYVFFAALYSTQPRHCISSTHSFLQILWFSVHTSATIGYGHMAPHPKCTVLNIIIVGQVLTSLFLQAVLLGVVYARFSTPNRRAHTIRFSQVMTLHTGSDGYARLSFRIANLRKHQVLRPELRMLLLRKRQQPSRHSSSSMSSSSGTAHRRRSSWEGDEWIYCDLPTSHAGGGRLWLGVPTVLRHVIDEESPLYGVGLQEMDRYGWEIIVVLDGYDESTSMPVQARKSYRAGDILHDTCFEPVIRRRPSGFLGVDFSSFDLTKFAAEGSEEEEDGGQEGRGQERTVSAGSADIAEKGVLLGGVPVC